jgi:hypothetical protein
VAARTSTFRENLKILVKDIEERARIIRDAHFFAARRWDTVHLGLGLAAVLIGVVGGGSAGTGVGMAVNASLAAVFATTAGLLAAASTFLRPSERIEQHKRAGDNWAALRDRAAELWALRISQEDVDEATLEREYRELLKVKEEIQQGSPIVPTWAFDKSNRIRRKRAIPDGDM